MTGVNKASAQSQLKHPVPEAAPPKTGSEWFGAKVNPGSGMPRWGIGTIAVDRQFGYNKRKLSGVKLVERGPKSVS